MKGQCDQKMPRVYKSHHRATSLKRKFKTPNLTQHNLTQSHYDVINYETFANEKAKPYAYANKLMSRQNV